MTRPAARYTPALDGLRAFAVVCVLLFHSTDRHPLPGGFVGVDVFFVLSGYLITTQLLNPRLLLWQFYARRFARLWPALIAVVLFVVATTASNGGVPSGLLFAATYILNICVAYGVPTGDATLVSHMWSLAIEVQFYLVWALAMRTMRRKTVRPSILLLITLTVAVTSYGLRSVYAVILNDPTRAYFATEARLDALFLGAAVAIAAVHFPAAVRHLAKPAAGLTVLAVVVAAFHFATTPSFLVGIPLAALGTVFLLATVIQAESSALMVGLGSRVPVWIGLRSYSLYLWHFPIFTLLRHHTALSGLPLIVSEWILALLAAALSFRVVETPARTWLYAKIGATHVPVTSSS